jgi:hypothetical protein
VEVGQFHSIPGIDLFFQEWNGIATLLVWFSEPCNYPTKI